MRLPKDLITGNYTKPNIFLCETDKARICRLETSNTSLSAKFNSYSEVSFDAARTYNDLITGETKVFLHYDKIEALRLIEIEHIGYFEIQGPKLSADGIKESKNVTAYSLEYTLSQKYLEDFYTVNGRDEWAGSLEQAYKYEKYGRDKDDDPTPTIVFYNPADPKASVLDLMLEKIYGWSIGHVDDSLKKLSRDFDVDRKSVYDFIMNEICEKFNCYAEFDTINNQINFYAESPTKTDIGDGETNVFYVSPPFSQIETVSIDGYKTTKWKYAFAKDVETSKIIGVLTLEEAPAVNSHIEIVGDMLQKWETDVFVTFDNLSQEIEVDYSSDDIKTVLTVTYGDDGDIREVNLGLPYLVDLSYYYTPEWMGQDLYDAYTQYLEKTNNHQANFTKHTQQQQELSNRQRYEEMRFGLNYSIVKDISSTTVGSFYVRSGDEPNYYYTEVSLPAEYKAGTTYYELDESNLNESKVASLYAVFQQYFNGNEKWKSDIDDLTKSFEFMKSPTLSSLKADLTNAITLEDKDAAILKFLNAMWKELGKTNLKSLYLDSYKQRQTTNMNMEADDDGKNGGNWSEPSNPNYWFYYPVTLMIKSIEDAITERTKTIDEYQKQIDALSAEITDISNDLLVENNFTEGQLIRLSAFLREDELNLDYIVETDLDSLEVVYKTKRDAMESGRIELQKRCQPQLQFSMTMANIYALPEFEPIVDQFQLGKVIKVALRPDYIKQSRLLQVDVGLDDFSDFSCQFGELTSLRTQSDIHADLLKNAVSAGKSVATNASYWTKGADKATTTDLKIRQGLLDAATEIKSIDGVQAVSIDKYGIHLRKEDPTNASGYDDKQGWIVNNQFLYSDDAFKTVKSVFGNYTMDNQSYWGLLAEAVVAGYIESSQIVGCDINIGDGAFVVDGKTGIVSMNGTGHNIEQLEDVKKDVESIQNKHKYEIRVIADGPTNITSPDETTVLTCEVYSWDVLQDLDPLLYNWKRKSANSATFIGDGKTTTFKPIPEKCQVAKVCVDSVAIDPANYSYNAETRSLTLGFTPEFNAVIDVIDIYDEGWNSDHRGTKVIKITHDDVYENSSFYCEVDVTD